MRGRLYDTLEFMRHAMRILTRCIKLLITFEIFNVHAMYVASLSCLRPLWDGRRAL